MVKAVVHQAQGSEDRFPTRPRALLSWFQSGRKGLGSCNRFEELNKLLYFIIYLFFQINKKFKYFCLTFRSPLRKPLSKAMKLKKFTVTDLRQLTTGC